MNEVKGNGFGWRYQCWSCNHQVKIDKPWPANCPGCGAGGWWGHLTPAISQNDVKRAGDNIKNPNETMSGGIKTPKRILSQLPDAVVLEKSQNNGVYEPTLGRGRGRPCQLVPGNLIKELDHQGLSSREIATELNERGIGVSYKTVQRRLQGSLL